MTELLARVRRNIGQARPTVDGHVLQVAGIRLDLERRRASYRERTVLLTEREFTLLAHLMRRLGKVCRREELLHDVWGLDFEPARRGGWVEFGTSVAGGADVAMVVPIRPRPDPFSRPAYLAVNAPSPSLPGRARWWSHARPRDATDPQVTDPEVTASHHS